ncbi:hypothetical protein JXA12_03115 [Candidatus Woesearchaeota archaeon]|nr:hypothetical protein [Candidatus Woesearchaeota archaeon]
MTEETRDRILRILDEHGVAYEHLRHGHVHRSTDAAKVRGTKLEQAAKALVLKEKKSGALVMFIVAGDRRLDLKSIKKDILCVKNVSLAPPEEVLERTGCTIGSVPPFGNLFNMQTYFDEHLKDTQEHIIFSAGTHHDSIKLKTKDFLHVTDPEVKSFSKPAGA